MQKRHYRGIRSHEDFMEVGRQNEGSLGGYRQERDWGWVKNSRGAGGLDEAAHLERI